ncbi:hypothetical protein JM93_00712 [Roseibium hamelinense]|uniref:Uncharacterized protein n=1 Tax=Roseibium hamelinense TaxID=150831 RepID=A0A562THN6_9HYPH|nr:hypothetical protein JM93_00712 [Roseibium hamelinense]
MRIVDLEGLADQIIDKIDLRTAHVFQGHGIDEDGDTVFLNGEVIVLAACHQVVFILQSGTAAAFD